MILILDNFDSFTYNIYQRVGELGYKSVVKRNDAVNARGVSRLKPSHIIISPGPKTPLETGYVNEIIRKHYKRIPILGICLGHQCIAHVFGGNILRTTPVHGKQDLIYHDGKGIYSGLRQGFTASRYHSLVVDREDIPDCLELSAWNKKGQIMGVRHKQYPVDGVQFHPESIITASGYKLLKNFIERTWKYQ
ncbi:MAG: aminodeoxychorismate/anthranilate synthase component II [Candidatus Altiarchaeota archaeon]|nr:aminodeoxychorismate/anthranilate synthase component II [Candidatus Altiarchaeota archaeon]